MTLEDIQQAIAKLSPEDRAKLRRWLAAFEAAQADREPETKASKFGNSLGVLWRIFANVCASPSSNSEYDQAVDMRSALAHPLRGVAGLRADCDATDVCVEAGASQISYVLDDLSDAVAQLASALVLQVQIDRARPGPSS